ncbi:hypothetical protein KEU06_18780 [Pseudaminobacter sp. 19-2017]|uniref:Uncharacterized protein n=1 Tax=Pseudaminobacter soli (ex Zhang et al. 2022) TaxID=2831468 RepID=A0A942IAM8_9HYPH|nr:hypothetical protein [Pseudaminobacter soli]
MSVNHTTRDIDALVQEEKRLTALECHTEAWAEGLSAGIEADIIAETALATALYEVFRSSGEEVALSLIDRMRERVLAGEFAPSQSRH